jgi:uncharacterized protein YdeI (YjbR/CyaY-like superfamily)
MPPPTDTPEIEVPSRAVLRDWLAANHTRKSGVWLVTYKKSEGALHTPYPDVVQECLAFGWIDSLPRKKDDRRSMLYIAPRKPGANWSRVNKGHVAVLEAAGLMTDAGRAAVARAKTDGTWGALDAVEDGEIPADLAAAFATNPGTEAIWHGWPRSVRRGALEILLNAKRPETRAARIAGIIDSAMAGTRPFQWRPRDPS